MHQTSKEWADILIELHGGTFALVIAKDILAMYTRGLNEYWTKYYKDVIEHIEIYIEENK